MPTWTFIKKIGAPAGTIRIFITAGEFDINDTTTPTITTTDQPTATDLSLSPYLQQSGVALSSIPVPPLIENVYLKDGVLSKNGPGGASIVVPTFSAAVDHVDMHGNSYMFWGPPSTIWKDNFGELAAQMLGAKSRRNISYSGSVSCHSDSNTIPHHGGWSWVLQNIRVPGMPEVSEARVWPYLPVSKVVINENALNDLAQLGHNNPTPYLHAHRAEMAARCLAAIYLASGADTAYGSGTDAALAFKNSAGSGAGAWTRTAGGGSETVTAGTQWTFANAGTGYLSTNTVGDKLTYTVAEDIPDGRVQDIFIPVAPTDDYVLTVTVGGVGYGTVHIQGSVICDPDAGSSALLNCYCMRLGSGGPTDPTGGVSIPHSAAVVLQMTTRTAGTFKVSNTGAESDPLDGPLLVNVSANRLPASPGYVMWAFAGFPHGPSAGTDPMNDAAVLSWISSQQTMEQAEFRSRVVSVNADAILGQNSLYWGDGGRDSTIDAHLTGWGHRALGRALYRQIVASPLLTDRVCSAARIIERNYWLQVGPADVSTVSFLNGWTNKNFAGVFNYIPMSFTVTMDDEVLLRGLIDSSAASSATLAQLPLDLRPASETGVYPVARVVINNGTPVAGFIKIDAAGNISLDVPAGAIGVTNSYVEFEARYKIGR